MEEMIEDGLEAGFDLYQSRAMPGACTGPGTETGMPPVFLFPNGSTPFPALDLDQCAGDLLR